MNKITPAVPKINSIKYFIQEVPNSGRFGVAFGWERFYLDSSNTPLIIQIEQVSHWKDVTKKITSSLKFYVFIRLLKFSYYSS